MEGLTDFEFCWLVEWHKMGIEDGTFSKKAQQKNLDRLTKKLEAEALRRGYKCLDDVGDKLIGYFRKGNWRYH